VGKDTGEEEETEDLKEAELRGIQLRLGSVCLIVGAYLSPDSFVNGKCPYSCE
jgi:hypothetical protein